MFGTPDRFVNLSLAGEKFFYDTSKNCLYFWIREPYYSAGKQYGWPGSPVGLGLNEEALEFAVEKKALIRVFVGKPGDRVYEVAAEDWKRFALEYGSIEKRGSAILYIVQWSNQIFKTVRLGKKGGRLNE